MCALIDVVACVCIGNHCDQLEMCGVVTLQFAAADVLMASVLGSA